MKRGVVLCFLLSVVCFITTLGSPPPSGKFVAQEVLNPRNMDNPSYLVFTENNRFVYHSEYYRKGHEFSGNWKRINKKKVKITFDPPGPADMLGSPPIGYISKYVIKVVDENTLLVEFYCPPPIHGNRVREFVRVPEE